MCTAQWDCLRVECAGMQLKLMAWLVDAGVMLSEMLQDLYVFV